jgi:hypothetical protein
VGVVLRHPSGGVIGLHNDPERAAALSGFAVLGFSVVDGDALGRLSDELLRKGVHHRGVSEGHLGWYLDVPDPDGILVRFHSGSSPDAEEA